MAQAGAGFARPNSAHTAGSIFIVGWASGQVLCEKCSADNAARDEFTPGIATLTVCAQASEATEACIEVKDERHVFVTVWGGSETTYWMMTDPSVGFVEKTE